MELLRGTPRLILLPLLYALVRAQDIGWYRMPTDAEITAGANPYAVLGTPPDRRVMGQWTFNGYAPVIGQAAVLLCGSDRVMFVDFALPSFRPGTGNRTDKHQMIGWIDYTTDRQGVLTWPEPNFNTDQNIACGGYVQMPNGTLIVHAGHGAVLGHPNGVFHIHTVVPNGTQAYGQSESRKYITGDVDLFVRPKAWGSNMYCSNTTVHGRWYPNPLILPDGRHYVAGGGTKAGVCKPAAGNEIWDPATNTLVRTNWTDELQNDYESFYLNNTCEQTASMHGIGCYPFVFLVPNTGHLVVVGYTKNQIITTDGRLVAHLPDLTTQVPFFRLLFPVMGTALMLGLPTYVPDQPLNFTIVIMGGGTQRYAEWRNASNVVASLRITQWPNGTYQVPPAWELDRMPYPRVYLEAILLPNKRVVIINGAAEYKLYPRGNKPITTPVLYNPNVALGTRFKLLAKTTIPRLYHSSATMTRRGCIFVGGCSDCNASHPNPKAVITPHPDHPNISFSPWGRLEFRVETFCPHYRFLPSPAFVGMVPLTVRYGSLFNVSFTMPTGQKLLFVTVMSPGSATHSVHMNRNLIELHWRIVVEPTASAVSPGIVEVTGPRDGTWAPPGCHLLFLVALNRAYTEGRWITFSK